MLVELLIAMTVLSLAVLSLVGGYSSGALALNRASRTDTAATLTDKQMQTYRAESWSQIASYSNQSAVGADGHTYNLQATVTTQNAPGTTRPVKYVSITVSDSSGHVWASEQSAFDQMNG